MISLSRFILLVATCCSSLLATDIQTAIPKTDRYFRLGVVAPFSGDAAGFGTSMKQGVTLAVEEWNAKGGVIGKEIQIFLGDDEGRPPRGAKATQTLISQNHVMAIVGAVMSKVSLICAPICQAAQVPMISPTSTNPLVTEVGDYIFRSCVVDPFQGTLGANFAFQDLKARKAACFYDSGNTYSQGLAQAFQERFRSLGGEVVAYTGHATWTQHKGYEGQNPPSAEYDPSMADFESQMQKLLATKPDVFYAPDYYEDVIRVAKKAHEMGYTGPLVGGDNWDCPTLHQNASKEIEGSFFTNHYAQDSSQVSFRAFAAKLKARFGSDYDPIAACGYDAANLMLGAVDRAGSTQGSAIRDALQATKADCLTGPIVFDGSRNPIRPAVIVEIKDRKLVYRTTVNP